MPANKHIRKFSLRVAIWSLWRKKLCYTFKQQSKKLRVHIKSSWKVQWLFCNWILIFTCCFKEAWVLCESNGGTALPTFEIFAVLPVKTGNDALQKYGKIWMPKKYETYKFDQQIRKSNSFQCSWELSRVEFHRFKCLVREGPRPIRLSKWKFSVFLDTIAFQTRKLCQTRTYLPL